MSRMTAISAILGGNKLQGRSAPSFSGMGSGGGPLLEVTRLQKIGGKQGVLKPDEDGCYTLCIGALNSPNNKGDHYSDANSVRALFSEFSSLVRRIAKGMLKAEYRHPSVDEISGYHQETNLGKKFKMYTRRLNEINTEKICCTFRAIWLDEENYTDYEGNKVVGIVAKIKPSGPFGPALERDLQSSGENVAFSIRSFSDDYIDGNGQSIKVIKNIVTFDHVLEQGIPCAEKLLSHSLEDFGEKVYESIRLTKDFVLDVLQGSKLDGVAMEDSGMSMLKEIADERGWLSDNKSKKKEEGSFFEKW